MGATARLSVRCRHGASSQLVALKGRSGRPHAGCPEGGLRDIGSELAAPLPLSCHGHLTRLGDTPGVLRLSTAMILDVSRRNLAQGVAFLVVLYGVAVALSLVNHDGRFIEGVVVGTIVGLVLLLVRRRRRERH